MTSCEEFQTALLDATSQADVERLNAAHGGCDQPSCRNAVVIANRIAEPLHAWSNTGPRTGHPAEGLVTRVLNDLGVTNRFSRSEGRRSPSDSRRVNWTSVALAASAMLIIGAGRHISEVPSTLLSHADPNQAAEDYLERTEQWFAGESIDGLSPQAFFEVSLDRPAAWLEENLAPFAETLQNAGEEAATVVPPT